MDDKPFNIVDYIPHLDLIGTGAGGWDIVGDSPYEPIVLSGPDGFIYQSNLDVSGWTKDGLTAFFMNQFLQRDGPYEPINPAVGLDTLELRDYVIVSDVPIRLGPDIIHAGFLDEASDFMTLKFAQAEVFTQSTTTGLVMSPIDRWMFGSGEPTASATLYITRIIIPHMGTPTPAVAVDCPAIRYVAQGIATEEPEYVYLNRLRRSNELYIVP